MGAASRVKRVREARKKVKRRLSSSEGRDRCHREYEEKKETLFILN